MVLSSKKIVLISRSFSLILCLSLQWRTQVDQFIHYDPIIQRKQREYRDPSTAGNSNNSGGGGSVHQKSQLNDDLNEIQSIMRKNIDEILNRGEKLDQVSNISHELRTKSKDFKWGAKKLTWQARMQQYGPMLVGGLIVLMVLYVKIFHIGF
jgi:vesicle transport protein SEC22